MKVFEFYLNPKLKEDRFLQVFSFEPKNPAEQARGTLYVLGELENALPSNSSFLKRLAESIREEYYGFGKSAKKQPSPEACLKAALKKANAFLAQETKEGNVSWHGNLHAAVLAIKPISGTYASLYFAKTGEAGLWLERNGKFVDMGSSLAERPQEPARTFGSIGAGRAAADDKILAVTQEVEELFTKERIWDAIARAPDEKALQRIFRDAEKKLKRASGALLLILLELTQKKAGTGRKFLTRPVLPLRLPEISQPESVRKRFFLIGALALILLFGFLVFQRGRNEELQRIQDAEARIETLLEQAAQTQSPQRSAIFLAEALGLARQHKEPGTPRADRFQTLEDAVERELFALHGGTELQAPEPFAELEEEFAPQRVFLIPSHLVFSSPVRAFIQTVDRSSQETERHQADSNLLSGAQAGASVFFYAEPNRVLEFTKERGLQERRIASSSSGALEIVDMAAFRGNLYVLDGATEQILKYPDVLRGGVSPEPWVDPSSERNAAKEARGVAVDGNIWVVKEGNELQRHYQGTYRETLSPEVFPGLGNVSRIETAETLAHLYLLEPGKNRLLVLTKFGELVAQFRSAAFGDLRDLAVSEDGNTVFLLNGNTVYRLENVLGERSPI